MRTKNARNPCFGTPIRPSSRLSHDFGRWWRSATFRDPEVGGTFDCRAGHVVPHAIDDSRGSDDKISKPESASRQAATLWMRSQAQALVERMDVSIDTTHFRLTSRRHGWEQVAECIRQQRIIKRWMHSRDARAEFEARAPYRRERGLLLQGALIVRDALLGSI